uniref:Uncharacterized protein n=1 Tax=Arundo donax TaxID=35708 RepID=A0A0A9F753_ARUDO
MRGATAPPPPS